MGLSNVLEAFASIIHDPSLFEAARIIKSSFTREDGKMPLRYLLNYLIFRHGRTLSEDINCFYSDLRINDRPSKQAVLKRMSILNHGVWQKIQELFLDRIYLTMEKRNYKGYLLIAIDGTFINLPDDSSLGETFGRRKCGYKNGEAHYGIPQAKVSIAYDVLNHIILDFRVAHCDTSEIPLLFQHLEALESVLKNDKVILLADRYYGSAELFKYCEMKGWKYLVRAKSNFFRKQRAEIPAECKDTWLTILIDRIWQKRIIRPAIQTFISEHPEMRIRLLRNHYEYEEEHTTSSGNKIRVPKSADMEYFTNLPQEEFSHDEIVNLYHNDRWDIETGYDILKNLIDIEEFNSARANVIYNEIMSRFIFSNLKSLLYNAASEKIQKDKEHLINNKNIIEKCHSSSFVRAFFKKKFSLKYACSCIKECSRFKVMVRGDRHLKRWDKFKGKINNTRHRLDGRRNPPLKITKAGIMTSNH